MSATAFKQCACGSFKDLRWDGDGYTCPRCAELTAAAHAMLDRMREDLKEAWLNDDRQLARIQQRLWRRKKQKGKRA